MSTAFAPITPSANIPTPRPTRTHPCPSSDIPDHALPLLATPRPGATGARRNPTRENHSTEGRGSPRCLER
jgi:hypothetical protein